MLFLKFGDEVKIVNPNHYDFGFEGIITEMSQDANEQIRYKIFKDYDIGEKEAWAYAYEIALINEPKMAKVEIDKNGVRLGKNLFEFNKQGIQIKPFRDYGDDAADAIKYCVEYKEEKEEGEKDNMKLLDLYEKKMAEKIKAECEEKFKEIKAQDDFTILRKAYEEDVKDLYEAEFEKEFDYEIEFEMTLETKETKEKMMEAEHEMAKKLRELRSTVEEIEAHLGIIPEGEYETVIKLLKKYGILNKEGKLNV